MGVLGPLIRSPAKEINGVRPVTAIVSGTSSGAAVLHTKSFLPETTTVDFTDATTGSEAVTRTAKTLEVMFGSS
jgi:hypothetical protein